MIKIGCKFITIVFDINQVKAEADVVSTPSRCWRAAFAEPGLSCIKRLIGTSDPISHYSETCINMPCRSLLISKPTLWRQNDFVVFFCLGVEDEKGQALFSSFEAFTVKLQGKTGSTILVNHHFCQIA